MSKKFPLPKRKSDELTTYKIMLMGKGGVGKSALAMKFVQKDYDEDYDPTDDDSCIARREVDGKTYILDVLDTEGQEEYSCLKDQYIQVGHCFLLVFSVADPVSFDAVVPLSKHILRVKEARKYPMIMVGNDFGSTEERKITTEQAEKLAKRLKVPYLEIKASDPQDNVEKAFQDLVELIRVYESKKRLRKQEIERPPCQLL